MPALSVIALIAALLAGAVGLLILWREPGAVAHRLFAAGMALAVLEGAFTALTARALLPGQMLQWQVLRLLTAAFVPAVWLLFSLVYSRGNYRDFVRHWWWLPAILMVVPLGAALVYPGGLVTGVHLSAPAGHLQFTLGKSGTVIQLSVILGAVLSLMNLERTFQASVGTMRWRIKLVLLGLAAWLAVQIYTSTQSLVGGRIDLSLEVLKSYALVLCSLLILFSMIRTSLFGVDLYPSGAFLSRSLTLVLAGIYLVAVGLLAKVVHWLGRSTALSLESLFVLASLLVLALVLLSDRLGERLARLVSRHLRRPRHDYRLVWHGFTRRTSACMAERDLCQAVVTWIAETFNLLSATVWLVDDTRQRLGPGGSTSVSKPDVAGGMPFDTHPGEVWSAMKRNPAPVNLEESPEPWVKWMRGLSPSCFPDKGGSRLAMPLVTGDEVLGVLVVGDRVSGVPWSAEDVELLGCVGDQTANALLGLRLSRRLVDSRETEAFQTMSTFFVHDLKNTASTLSLMLENLPAHFDNPAFRSDALQAIAKSVARINQLVSGLGRLRQKIELRPAACDLNALLSATLDNLQAAHQLPLTRDLQPLPRLQLDAEQFEKVITNLTLNAEEALGPEGQIRVATALRNGWAVLTVSDNGCGMTPEFVTRSLFRPFQTTKKKGIGIGMFHCKQIVEAHRGWMEVESAPGQGTTFRVLLPVAAEAAGS